MLLRKMYTQCDKLPRVISWSKLTTFATVDVLWQNFSKSRIQDKFQNEAPLYSDTTISLKKHSIGYVPKTVRRVRSFRKNTDLWQTDGQIDSQIQGHSKYMYCDSIIMWVKTYTALKKPNKTSKQVWWLLTGWAWQTRATSSHEAPYSIANTASLISSPATCHANTTLLSSTCSTCSCVIKDLELSRSMHVIYTVSTKKPYP